MPPTHARIHWEMKTDFAETRKTARLFVQLGSYRTAGGNSDQGLITKTTLIDSALCREHHAHDRQLWKWCSQCSHDTADPSDAAIL